MHSRTFGIISAASRHSPFLLRSTTHRAFHTSVRTLTGIPSHANAPVKTSTRLATKNDLPRSAANKPIFKRAEHVLAPPSTLPSGGAQAQRIAVKLEHLLKRITNSHSSVYHSAKARFMSISWTIPGTGPRNRFNTITFYALLGSIGGFFVFQVHAVVQKDRLKIDFIARHFYAKGVDFADWRPWTMMTSLLVHGDIYHLLANMAAFWLIAPPLLTHIGYGRFLAIFFVGGGCATAFSLASRNCIEPWIKSYLSEQPSKKPFRFIIGSSCELRCNA
jgi:hypothetical protein